MNVVKLLDWYRIDTYLVAEGKVRSLAWNSVHDLDLHVVCPSGEIIWYHNRAFRRRQLGPGWFWTAAQRLAKVCKDIT